MRASHAAELRAFVAIAEARSFRHAADRLGLTASTPSHSLRALEERRGVQLLARTTRTVAPTEAGAELLRSLWPALAAVEEAVEGANAFRDRPRGRLRPSVPRPAATQVLQPRLAAFAEAFPDVTLEVGVDDRLVDIVRQGFDADIRLGESVARDMVALRVTPDGRAAVVGSPADLARHAPPRVPQDLHRHLCINRRLPRSGTLLSWPFAKDGTRVAVAVEGPLTLDADNLRLAAARDGVGLAMMSEADAGPDLAADRLRRVLENWGPPEFGFFLYHLRSRQPSASLRAPTGVLALPPQAASP